MARRGERGELLDPQARDGPGDDELLDLFGALEDVEDPPGVSASYRLMPLTCTLSGARPAGAAPYGHVVGTK